jgi:hypothetical protein
MNIEISLNNNISYNLVKKKNLFFLIIFTKNYYIQYKINTLTTINYSKNCKTIVIHTPYLIQNNKFNKNTTFINEYNFSVLSYFFQKIIFSGKSYKIKKRKFIFLEFNKSHKEIFI